MLCHLRYGDIEVLRDGDGFRVVAETAGAIIALSPELFIDCSAKGIVTATTYGDVLICGVLRYRPVGVDEGCNFVFQRIDDIQQ